VTALPSPAISQYCCLTIIGPQKSQHNFAFVLVVKLSVKWKVKVYPVHATKAYGGEEVYLH
jgi:hypothetical protein